jgi:cobalt-zinc-cadmium efflux system membrane fusion protein
MPTMCLSVSRSAAKSVPGWLLAIALLVNGSAAFAHGGEIEVGAGARGPVSLSIAQQKAIGLQRVEAGFRPLAELLNLNGEVRLVPGRQADVSTRISGQVKALYAKLGDRVKAGQRLLRVQSRLVGDPPPSVNIPAPMSGLVDAVNVALGQSVEPATVLYRISDRSQVNVVARLYEEDVAKIRVGQIARVHTLSYPDRVFSGKVILVGPSLDPQSRTLEVWIRLANPEGLLKPNLFARASVVLKQNSAALSIPRAAVIEANGEKFVFVPQGNQFKRVEITLGVSDDQYVEVSDGLVPGDAVVTQGNRQLYTQWLTGGKPLKGGDED